MSPSSSRLSAVIQAVGWFALAAFLSTFFFISRRCSTFNFIYVKCGSQRIALCGESWAARSLSHILARLFVLNVFSRTTQEDARADARNSCMWGESSETTQEREGTIYLITVDNWCAINYGSVESARILSVLFLIPFLLAIIWAREHNFNSPKGNEV